MLTAFSEIACVNFTMPYKPDIINHSNVFEKFSLSIFQKMKYDALYSSLFRKIAVLQSKKCTFLSVLIFYRITHASCEIKRPWNDLSWQKQIIWKVWHDILQYRKSTRASKIQEILYYEHFAEHYLCIKQYFHMFFSTPKHVQHAKNEINH